MKICSKCGEEYPATIEYFYLDRCSKSGLQHRCKKCQIEHSKSWREKNRKRYHEYNRKRYEENREEHLKKSLKWYYDNRERAIARRKEWGRRPKNAISQSISAGIRTAIGSRKAGRKWETLVGYTLNDLMAHLESQFTKGMTWDNYGEWHIDHIRPISDFSIVSSDSSDFKVCWSLWNLQPLWGEENMRKHNKCDALPLPLLPKGVGE